MGNVMTYSGIVTKVRAMQAKLLTDQDYKNIAALLFITEAMWRKYCINHYTMIGQKCSGLRAWNRRNS